MSECGGEREARNQRERERGIKGREGEQRDSGLSQGEKERGGEGERGRDRAGREATRHSVEKKGCKRQVNRGQATRERERGGQ